MEYGKVLNILSKIYNPYGFAERYDKDPYKVLIACILSLRTKDKVTDEAAERLFKKASIPKEMLKLSEKQIQKLIYPVGFFRNKTKTIKEISKTLVTKYNSKVPDELEDLLKFKGVGRKTANIVITFAFNKPGIAVDIHVHRISNRLGWVKTKTPDETELVLRETLPNKYWIIINNLFVRFGQNICLPRNPKCRECPVNNHCKYYQEVIS